MVQVPVDLLFGTVINPPASGLAIPALRKKLEARGNHCVADASEFKNPSTKNRKIQLLPR